MCGWCCSFFLGLTYWFFILIFGHVGANNANSVGPMLVVLAGWVCFLVLDELWDVVGPVLRKTMRCLSCGFCGRHQVVLLRDDYVNEEEHMKQYGLSSYNIFDNPIYQAMFNINQEYASEHKHLESLLMTEMNHK